ncbi:MAG: hypothetical protein JWQ83_1118 [Lacunisphaera sp.]|jgi:hypothetical protein|nr:hypothetical protein [Lacunisphaera sp.]MDB6165978.1 hypothetical protein [Lacunisphaera sp.]
MNTAQPAPLPLSALRCWVQGRRIYLEINSRRSVSFPASKYSALVNAGQAELENIHLNQNGRSINWASIDEEIQVEDVANNRFFHTPRATGG